MENITQTRPDYTIADICDRFQVSKPTVYDLIKSGALRAYKLGRATRITAESVEDLRANGGTV